MHDPVMASARIISASDFKARCLRILDDVQVTRVEVVITRRGKPIARLGPTGPARRSLRGAWKGMIRIHGDIVQVDWSRAFAAVR